MSSMEFLKWRVYLDEHELNGFHREDYFLAQIAQFIVMANSKNPQNVHLKQFLLKFTKEKRNAELSEASLAKRMAYSRAAWGMLTGADIPMDDLKEMADE